MSGLEIVGAVTGLLGVVRFTEGTYKLIKDYKDLPTEFREVGERLPIAERTLSIVEAQANNAENPEEALAAIRPLLDSCQEKTERLQGIFNKAGQWGENSVRARYRKLVGTTTGKGKQVEKLMAAILKDVQALAADRVFETATTDQMEELKKAIEDLANLQPDESDGTSGNQNVYGNMRGKLIYQQGSGTVQAPDGDIIGRDKVVGMDIRPKKLKSSDDDDSSSD